MPVSRFSFIALSLFLSACAPTIASDSSWQAPRWSYKQNSGVGLPDGPIALYGSGETLADVTFSCAADKNALDFTTLDVKYLERARTISIETGGVKWSGVERLDAPDGVSVSRASISLADPVLDAIARAHTPIIIRSAGMVTRLPGGEVIGRVIRECREVKAALP